MIVLRWWDANSVRRSHSDEGDEAAEREDAAMEGSADIAAAACKGDAMQVLGGGRDDERSK